MWTEEYLFWPNKKLINNSNILRVNNDAKTSAKTKSMSKLLKQNDHDIKNKNIFSCYLEIDYTRSFNLHPIFSFEKMGAFATLKNIG